MSWVCLSNYKVYVNYLAVIIREITVDVNESVLQLKMNNYGIKQRNVQFIFFQ